MTPLFETTHRKPMNNRIVEPYRGYQLVAAEKGLKYVGKAWKDEAIVLQADGGSIDEVLVQLRSGTDKLLADRAATAPPPSDADYLAAFKRILPTLSDGHLAMLKAHHRARDRSLTATQLAAAAKYSSYRAVNLQYGEVGKRLWEQLPTQLPRDSEDRLIFTFALCDESDRSMPEDQWIWVMRPEVAAAVKQLGLHN